VEQAFMPAAKETLLKRRFLAPQARAQRSGALNIAHKFLRLLTSPSVHQYDY
jgi:hypothetical protein